MSLESPACVLAIEAMFANIKPGLDGITKLGTTDFSKDAPGVQVKPGATIKVPISSVSAAGTYDASSNHYGTGGDTSWAELTCAHYLKGFDITGVNVDQGADAGRMKALFTSRAGTSIAAAVQAALASALDGTTTSTGVTCPAVGSATLADYMKLSTAKGWMNGPESVLALNGAELANVKALFAAAHIMGSNTELAQFLGFKDMVLVPGMTDRMCIVPAGSMGFVARVPEIIVKYRESGVETDPDTGLSIGIVINEDGDHNRLIANADLWFGVAAQSCAQAAAAAGIVNVGTAT